MARDRFLAGDEARNDLHLHIAQRLFLRFGKLAHIVVREADIIFQFLR
jgi:hypothetical protein